MFKYLKKKIEKKIKLKEKVKNKFFLAAPLLFFDQKLFITLVSQINKFPKLYLHVCYAMAYYHK